MDFVLSAVLRLLHPFMPHITEELWSLLRLGSGSIQFAAPPQKVALDEVEDIAGKRQLVLATYQTVQAGRNLRASAKLPSNRKIGFILRTDEKLISSEIPTLTRLLNAEEVTVDPKYREKAGNPVAVTQFGEIFLTVAAADTAREQERPEDADRLEIPEAREPYRDGNDHVSGRRHRANSSHRAAFPGSRSAAS